MKEMPVAYHHILNRVERQEARLLRQKPSPLSAPEQALRAKIPSGVQATLEHAFFSAFSTLFGPNGTKVLEYTYDKKKLREDYGFWLQDAGPARKKRELRRMERQGLASRLAQSAVCGVEGTALGLLGIGLPDIPVLLGALLRSLYQSAARYGYSCDSPEERFYLLLLLQGSLAEGDERTRLSQRADLFARSLDHQWPVSFDLDAELRSASALLAQRLLLLKFVQGIPVVGAVGGATNLSVSHAVARYGALKYRKRFLEQKMRGL